MIPSPGDDHDVTHSLVGAESEWAYYLQSLPRETVPIGIFWGYDYEDGISADVDSIEARSRVNRADLERGLENEETGEYILASVTR